jgi:predicted membrane-bound spermidine synthase
MFAAFLPGVENEDLPTMFLRSGLAITYHSRVPWLLFLLVFALGILSMGLQLVASRVLSPFFGSSIFVWASLITTFLAAFSGGSFLGAMVSSRPASVQRRIILALMATGSASLLFDSFASYLVCDWLDLRIDTLLPKLILSCVLLYFVPVAALSALTPVCIQFYDRQQKSAGRSAGLLNSASTLGNIAGVLLAAFVFIPTFGIRQLLHAWWISSLILQASLWFVIYCGFSRSPVSLPQPMPEK